MPSWIDPSLAEYVKVCPNAVVGNGTWIITHGPIRPYMSDPRVVIEPHAYIGARCIILLGVRIGRGAIIGAGSVVSRDIPAFSVAAGNPAKPHRCATAKELLRMIVNKKMNHAPKTQGKFTQGTAMVHPFGKGAEPNWALLTIDDIKDLFGFNEECKIKSPCNPAKRILSVLKSNGRELEDATVEDFVKTYYAKGFEENHKL